MSLQGICSPLIASQLNCILTNFAEGHRRLPCLLTAATCWCMPACNVLLQIDSSVS